MILYVTQQRFGVGVVGYGSAGQTADDSTIIWPRVPRDQLSDTPGGNPGFVAKTSPLSIVNRSSLLRLDRTSLGEFILVFFRCVVLFDYPGY